MLLFLCSCGGVHGFKKDEPINQDAQEAAFLIQGLSDQIDAKLVSLHSYYVIAQKYLLDFDQLIEENNLEGLHRSSAYLSLLAARTQINEIERELEEISNNAILKERILHFEQEGKMNALSLQNISEKLNINLNLTDRDASLHDIQKEYHKLVVMNEFIIFEKNIEHLSYLMEMELKTQRKKRPTSLSGDQSHHLGIMNLLDWPPQSSGRILKRAKLLMKKTSSDYRITNDLQENARVRCTTGTFTREMNEGEKTVCLKI